MRGLGLVGEADGRASGSGVTLLVEPEVELCYGLGRVPVAGGAGGPLGLRHRGCFGLLGLPWADNLGHGNGYATEAYDLFDHWAVLCTGACGQRLVEGLILLDVCPCRAGLGDRGQRARLSRRARLGICRGRACWRCASQGPQAL